MVLDASFCVVEGFLVLFVVEVGARSVGVVDMIVGVELDGLSEELDCFLVSMGLEGLISFVFEFDCLLFGHKIYILILEHSLNNLSTLHVLVHSFMHNKNIHHHPLKSPENDSSFC